MAKWVKTRTKREDLKGLLTDLKLHSPYDDLIIPHNEDDIMYDIIGVAINDVEVIDRLAVVTYNPFNHDEYPLAYFNDDDRVWYVKSIF